jgi:hypothetical protein
MPEAPASPISKRRMTRRRVARSTRPSPPVAWTSDTADPVEVVAPDSELAGVLLDYAAPLFPGEIVSGREVIVRLQPAPGPGWVLELLSLVDRWVESTRLPGATVRYGGRSYPIRALNHVGQPASAGAAATG